MITRFLAEFERWVYHSRMIHFELRGQITRVDRSYYPDDSF